MNGSSKNLIIDKVNIFYSPYCAASRDVIKQQPLKRPHKWRGRFSLTAAENERDGPKWRT
ncbi:MAG: hypothetical protein CXT68_00115 [Methanobacteriota archaeon]|jgi:hypothetical protein|nr:MAG: hypothetical protein CXT68_00115 [Euryarchaeota archaeon]